MECSSKNAPKSNQFIAVCDSYTSDILYVTYVNITCIYTDKICAGINNYVFRMLPQTRTRRDTDMVQELHALSNQDASSDLYTTDIWLFLHKKTQHHLDMLHEISDRLVRLGDGDSYFRRSLWSLCESKFSGVLSNNAAINNRSMHRLNRFNPRIRV